MDTVMEICKKWKTNISKKLRKM